MTAAARRFEHTVTIDAPPTAVWEALTRPDVMSRWMGEPGMRVEVVTGWVVGGPIRIRGFHHVAFENRGTVLRFEPPERLVYTHLSSLSRLPDEDPSYSTFDFHLGAIGDRTSLALAIDGFPTEAIFHHVRFYWRGTLPVLKALVEGSAT